MTRRPAIMSWSSGKDSAFALHTVREAGHLDVVALVSTCSQDTDCVAVHGTRRDVVRAQAQTLDLPLSEVTLPQPCPNTVYEARMGEVIRRYRAEGVNDWIFGDFFLSDIRAYREAQLAPFGITAHFPLWGRETRALAGAMLEAGIDARIAVLDPERMPRHMSAARFDAQFLDALPETVDPCGERGEFHTVVADAPGFARPLDLVSGETHERRGFLITDFALAKRSKASQTAP